MRKPLVMGNWKLNGSTQQNQTLLTALLAHKTQSKTEIVICPPFVYLNQIRNLTANSAIQVGAQNVSAESSGAFTGEISTDMLKDMGCTYVILGHSERRALYGETDAVIAEKFKKVCTAGLIPVLCVGETLEQFEAGESETVVREQLKAVLDANSIASFENAVIAYEPVWAIGTGKTATPEIAQTIHAAIRSCLAEFDQATAERTRILYGGSVKGANAPSLLAMPDIDGALVGGASLIAEEFTAICNV